MNNLISIIIPVYNKQDTIIKCVESVENQDYSNIEVILIDDGSKDNSAHICEDLSNKYLNIVFTSRPNKGVSLTYKEGIDKSSGNFVIFLDSDDYIESGMISSLFSKLDEYQADIVQSGLIYRKVSGTILKKDKYIPRIIESKTILLDSYFIKQDINRTFAGAIFKKELFENVCFPPGALSIDIQVMPYVLVKCKKYVLISDCFYNAIMFEDSVSLSSFTEIIYEDKTKCTLVLKSFFEEFAPEMASYLYYRNALLATLLYYKINESQTPIKGREAKIREFKDLFDNNYKSLKNSVFYEHINKLDKIKLYLFSIHPKFFYIFKKIYSIILSVSIN